jgi:hypothetical protein
MPPVARPQHPEQENDHEPIVPYRRASGSPLRALIARAG